MGYRPIRFDTVGSTNDIALEAARAGEPAGLVVVARVQASGKGRQARDWRSPEGGLWASVILEAELASHLAGLVPLAVGCACCEALGALGADVGLRWPNDLMLEDAKVGGILVESASDGGALTSIVAGIGINVRNDPPVDTAGTLAGESRTRDPDTVLDAILETLESYEGMLREGEGKAICQAFMRHAWGMDRQMLLDGQPRIPKEIAVDGALIVETPEGDIEVHRSGSLRPAPER